MRTEATQQTEGVAGARRNCLPHPRCCPMDPWTLEPGRRAECGGCWCPPLSLLLDLQVQSCDASCLLLDEASVRGVALCRGGIRLRQAVMFSARWVMASWMSCCISVLHLVDLRLDLLASPGDQHGSHVSSTLGLLEPLLKAHMIM